MQEWYCKVNETPGKQEGGTINEISQERLERFWKWCGFENRWDAKRVYIVQWKYPNGETRAKLPKCTLNSLFKWAVPKLYPYPENKIDIHFKRETSYPDHTEQIHCWFYLNGKMYKGWSLNDPAIALLLAVDNLIAEGQ